MKRDTAYGFMMIVPGTRDARIIQEPFIFDEDEAEERAEELEAELGVEVIVVDMDSVLEGLQETLAMLKAREN